MNWQDSIYHLHSITLAELRGKRGEGDRATSMTEKVAGWEKYEGFFFTGQSISRPAETEQALCCVRVSGLHSCRIATASTSAAHAELATLARKGNKKKFCWDKVCQVLVLNKISKPAWSAQQQVESSPKEKPHCSLFISFIKKGTVMKSTQTNTLLSPDDVTDSSQLHQQDGKAQKCLWVPPQKECNVSRSQPKNPLSLQTAGLDLG